MRIYEVIADLADIARQHGDIDVYYRNAEGHTEQFEVRDVDKEVLGSRWYVLLG